MESTKITATFCLATSYEIDSSAHSVTFGVLDSGLRFGLRSALRKLLAGKGLRDCTQRLLNAAGDKTRPDGRRLADKSQAEVEAVEPEVCVFAGGVAGVAPDLAFQGRR